MMAASSWRRKTEARKRFGFHRAFELCFGAADLYWAWKGVVRELVLSIDAMGGDAGPAAAVAGAAIARRRHPKVHFLLHGDEAILKPLLAKHRALAKRAEIRHA